jgi:hypothetical protein
VLEFNYILLALQILQTQPLIAPAPDVASVGTQLFAALVVGLLTAFAFQLLLTSFGVAAGLTTLGLQFRNRNRTSEAIADSADSADSTESAETNEPTASGWDSISTIGFAAGCGILLSVNTALGGAAFLATKFSVIHSPISGAIIGIVIWSAYFLLVTWLSSSAVTSLIGVIFSSATSGFRQLITAISAALNRSDDSDEPLTQAAMLTAIRQEVQIALNAASMRQAWEEALTDLPPLQPDPQIVRQELEAVINDLSPESRAALNQFDRHQFVELIHERTQLPKPEAEQVVESLSSHWTEAIAHHPDLNTELLQFLQSANPEALKFEQLSAKLEQLLDMPEAETDRSDWLKPLQKLDLSTIKRTILQRIDLSDLDVAHIWQHIQNWQQKLSHSEDTNPSNLGASAPFSTIWTDIEDYLQYADLAERSPDKLATEFESVIYDSEAAPELVQAQLEAIQPEWFAGILQQRDDLTTEQIAEISDRLETVQQQVLETVIAAQIAEQQAYLQQQFDDYCRTANKDDLNLAQIQQNLIPLLEASGFGAAEMVQFWTQIDRSTVEQLLQQRDDLSKKETKQIAKRLHKLSKTFSETWCDRLSSATSEQADEQSEQLTDSDSTTLWQKLESYLRYTSPKRLTPAKVADKLQTLAEMMQTAVSSAKGQVPTIDRTVILEVLERRQGLSKKQIQQITDQIETTWEQVIEASQTAAQRGAIAAQDQALDLLDKLTHYLDQVDGSPESLAELQHNLLKLFEGTVASAWLLRRQLAQLDWQTLSDRLQQIGWSESRIQLAIDLLKAAVHKTVKFPRRWAVRAQNLQTAATQQVEHAQQQTQSTVDTLFTTLSHSLDLTKMDYTQLKQELLQGLDGSSSGFELLSQSIQSVLEGSVDSLAGFSESGRELLFQALRDRLSQANQEILSTLLQTRSVPQAIQNQIMQQVERVRDRLMTQVEQLQDSVQNRVDAVKLATQKRAEATRKAAVTAAWWLFATAFTSAMTAAIAGVVAVTGIHLEQLTQIIN